MKKYEEIYHSIKEKILDGTYQSKEQLPFEKDFCQTYNTSKMTVKRALDLLVEDGLIIKRRGSGTFVKDLSKSEIERLSDTYQLTGLSSFFNKGDIESDVLSFSVNPADDSIAEKLNVNVGSFVYDIHRIRKLNGKPIVIEQSYIPIEVVPGLEEKHVEGSIYSYIREDLNLNIQSAHRRFTVKKATGEEASYLSIAENDPVAVTEQSVYLDDGTSMEYSITKHRSDEFAAETIITK